MKKLLAFILAAAISGWIAADIHAVSTVSLNTQKVELNKDQSQFALELTLNEGEAFAGADIGIKTNSGVVLKSFSTASKNAAKTGPVVSKEEKITYIGFSNADNLFKKVMLVLKFECTAGQGSSISLDNITVWRRSGNAVKAQRSKPGIKVTITRK